MFLGNKYYCEKFHHISFRLKDKVIIGSNLELAYRFKYMITLVDWINAFFFWVIGILLFIHTIQRWNFPPKKTVRYSELIQGMLFLLMGFYILTLFSQNSLFPRILFGIYLSLIIFFLGLNVFPNVIRKWLNPSFRQEISYESFLTNLRQKYDQQEHAVKADRVKDFSRKILHFFQFAGLLLTHEITQHFESEIISLGISAIGFRNFIYFIVAGLFWIMMVIGDLLRMDHWEFLPKWGWKWYEKSLEPTRESWTLNAATPILLANLTWIHPIVPFQVLLSAAWVSCIADAFASIIGKNFGTHHLDKIGIDSKKTYEGLIAGIVSTFLGIWLIFVLYPVSSFSLLIIFGLALVNSIAFAFIDLYSRNVSDNLLNSLMPGSLTWLSIFLFSL
ncbi:hypothetical protein NEF87_003416 [Candidatus Lokiarchaeum ossiferum]|uniref:Cytidylyltransferase family protein n=1 Tax=Candidatus Lokiarchaeum ossiferum TaxID=2951803 RepID=A0ABY6HX24_9ARCH|nr:hypothetical protein NEF87_003416 [Candidatus Lokiarchaeum sp. B-35]